MVPEQDIIGQAGKLKTKIWLIGLGSVLFAIIIATWIYRKYLHKSGDAEQNLFDINDQEASIHRIIERGEGTDVEFKSTIRMNLHTRKPGREIELAWLKGVAAFLNTNGGVLLLGVNDNGEVTGLEQDVFENEDKCKLHVKNLIGQHLGADQSKHIRFHIAPVGDRTVGIVLCQRSLEPVFLKMSKSEAFYIRNGPSSDELPVSMALNYIKNRK
jgi:predicted HTH transcriptional regulator